MNLAPAEQRALLRMERSLRGDSALKTAFHVFSCESCRGVDPDQEDLSPWHPVLWRAELLALITVTLAFFAMIGIMVYVAL